MLDAYSNATLTIAATASRNSQGGLFYTRSPLAISPCFVVTERDGLQDEAWIACRGDIVRLFERYDSGLAPLGARGWATQERLLSRRILHCAEDQLYWECAAGQACEVFPETDDSGKQTLERWVNISQVSDPAYLTFLWLRIRERYAGTDLTLDRDRLPAISGLARRVHEILHLKETDYLAGLERDNLAKELQWYAHGPKGRRRTVEYCAPIWSWAAGKGAIYQSSMCKISSALFEILDAETFPIEDPYGQVSGGYIRIRGRICQVTLTEHGHGLHDQEEDVAVQIESVVVNGHTRTFCFVSWDGDTRGTLLRHYGCSFFFLLCHLDLEQRPKGLLLQRECEWKGKFRRVAWFDFGERFSKDIRAAFSAGMLTEDDYLDFDGVDQYTIEII